MAVRQTSIDCYNQIKANGLLSDLRLLTYHAMLNSAPCTAGELQKYIELNEIKVKHSWKLLSQLRDLGVIYEKGTKKCTITGKTAIEWDLTDKLPIKLETSANTKKNRVDTAINSLRELYKNKINATTDDWQKVANLIRSI